MLQPIYDAFGITENADKAIPFGSGLINTTWKITNGGNAYILQRINHNVFKKPELIAHNINITGQYLHNHYPDYLFVMPLKTIKDKEIYFDKDKGYFRLVPFIKNSHTIDVVTNAQIAFEAATQFGRLTKLLSGFNASLLKITLPDFHNLSFRFMQFKQAVANGNLSRIKGSKKLIDAIFKNEHIGKNL
ncbi:MAG: phosphotransferase enzyme family protein, partial [Ginsengibacter sp.]